MNALQIAQTLKKNKSAVLWLNRDRKQAALHNGEYSQTVGFNDAVIARGDPSIISIEENDGEAFAAL